MPHSVWFTMIISSVPKKLGYPGFMMDQLLSILNNDRTFPVDGTLFLNSECPLQIG